MVEDEHHPSYKQQDAAPRFHVRNAALVLAERHGAMFCWNQRHLPLKLMLMSERADMAVWMLQQENLLNHR